MIPFEHIELTDGTTANTLYLHDGVQYAVYSWAAAVAPRDPSELDGRGDYADVQETMTLDVFGDSAVNCADNLNRILRLLDQAQRWWDNENVTLVKIRVRVQDSTVGIVESVILGPGRGEPPGTVDPVYDVMLDRWRISGVTLTFIRRALWIGTTDTETALAAVPAGDFFTFVFDTNHPLRSPLRIRLSLPSTPAAPGTDVVVADNFLILTDASAKIQVVEAENIGASGIFTVVAPAAADQARGGNVLRATPAAANTTYTTAALTVSLLETPGTYIAFLIMRGSLTSTCQVRLQLTDKLGNVTYTAWTAISLTANTAVPVSLGPLVAPPDIGLRNMAMQIQTASVAGGPVFDTDYVTFVRADQALSVTKFDRQVLNNSIYGVSTAVQILIEPRPLTHTQPLVGFSKADETLKTGASYAGDSYPMQAGTAYAGIWLATQGDATTRYRFCNYTAGGLYNTTVIAVRQRGYLTPP